MYKTNEAVLAKVDRMVDLGARYGIHIHFVFHHGPGYSVNHPGDSAAILKE